MGLLNLFSKAAPTLLHLPSGSFTIDREGKIMTSTLPQSFPEQFAQSIGRQILTCFRSADKAQIPLTEIILTFSALKILARELRGGAIVFLMPQAISQPQKRP